MRSIQCVALAVLACTAFGEEAQKQIPVTGTVVDPDGRPLHEYTLEMRVTRPDPAASGGKRERLERVTTDAQGRFTSALPHTSGPVRFTRVDTDATTFQATRGGLEALDPVVRDFERKHDGTPIRLEVPCGPAFQLSWKARENPEEHDGPALGASSARLIAVEPGVIDEGSTLATSLRVRDELHGWVRFGGLPPRGPDARLVLEVLTVDGRWKSTADVTELAPKGGGALALEWRPACRWIGSVPVERDRGGERTWFFAEQLDETGAVLLRLRRELEPDGRVVFRGLDPGRWRFATRPLFQAPWSSGVLDLEFAKPPKTPIDLQPLDGITPLACLVTGGTAEEGSPPPRPGRVRVARPGAEEPLAELELVWAMHEGRWLARVELPRVAPGEYALTVLPPQGTSGAGVTRTARAGGPVVEIEWR